MSLTSKLLTLVKKSVMLEDETFADEELTSLIESCFALLRSTGVKEEHFSAKEVESLMLIYVKTFFGFASDGSVKELPQSFYFLLKQISLSKGE